MRIRLDDGTVSRAFLVPPTDGGKSRGRFVARFDPFGFTIVDLHALAPGADVGPPGITATLEESDDQVTWFPFNEGNESAVSGERKPSR